MSARAAPPVRGTPSSRPLVTGNGIKLSLAYSTESEPRLQLGLRSSRRLNVSLPLLSAGGGAVSCVYSEGPSRHAASNRAKRKADPSPGARLSDLVKLSMRLR